MLCLRLHTTLTNLPNNHNLLSDPMAGDLSIHNNPLSDPTAGDLSINFNPISGYQPRLDSVRGLISSFLAT